MIRPEYFSEEYGTAATISPLLIRKFQETIHSHFRDNPRPMPWRETSDPYRILVSEIMLQQTQVERVKSKYAEFLAAFPTVSALAKASLPAVLGVWQGLGYNRRAIALKNCAQEIMTSFEGSFPGTVAELESLPGIGPYTARAVALFAFGVVEPFIETNIRTVFLHFFFHGREHVHDREIMPLVEATIDHGNPREWYYALMDYGVMLKRCHVNPGRRSAHYAQQSPFKGSNRQLRSRMLSMIMAHSGVAAGALAAALEADTLAVERNLQAMEREGFVVREGDEVYVRQH
ncbi:A/G-specific adenine glycosylase [Pelotalea chapellei]|uniref:Adenine DNA glycosylase n=1 Tax=Pelotalea chapellei TaxID=44671 RepID=A0ABS5U848_9BACT|nr:A/G-specific adenine glycosylase [Pelotalea chapellei]MBT1071844.1 A/G-specific adenine glycosylase [Pelotalea chapellei]